MTNKFKTLLKTSAALATLFAGSQTWGAAISFATMKSDGTLGNTHPVHGVFGATSMPAVAVPDKVALVLNNTSVAATSGGVVALGSELYVDFAAGWTILDLVAIQNLDVFLRPNVAATATTVEFTNVILSGKAQSIKFWNDAGITLTDPTLITKEARSDRDSDPIPQVDLPAPTPTKVIGGRTYTLNKHYSSQ